VGGGQDSQKRGWAMGQHTWGVDVAQRPGDGGGHHLERLLVGLRVGPAAAVDQRFDQDDPERPAVAVSTVQLILQNWSNEALVEQPCGPVHYVERLGLPPLRPHTPVWTQ